MKKLILTLSLICIAFVSFSQESTVDYKAYKPCSECFEKWSKSKTGLENYGIYSDTKQKKRNSGVSQHGRAFIGGIVAICTAAVSLVIYSKINNVANEIR